MGISGKLLSRDELYHSVLTPTEATTLHQEKWVFTQKMSRVQLKHTDVIILSVAWTERTLKFSLPSTLGFYGHAGDLFANFHSLQV
jgi:hypothetical protein